MENSPLTLAHTHARNAVLETRRSNPVAASEEHDLAAAEFANAAQGTLNAEALRTLHLLEQHHKKLAEIIKFRHEHPHSEVNPGVREDEEVGQDKQPADSPSAETAKQSASPEPLQQPPRLAGNMRATARELSSSIASNLASARGIPGGQRRGVPVSPTISAQHAPGKFAKDQAKTRDVQLGSKPSKIPSAFSSSNHPLKDGKPSWAPPAQVPSNDQSSGVSSSKEPNGSSGDAPFQQFYNTFESLVSKLSAPLAFTSLPLVTKAPPTSTHDQPTKQQTFTTRPTKENDLDYSQLISRAALRAVQDGQSPSYNPAESFYVVPTTGGTISYADIMTRTDREPPHLQHARHLSNLSEDTMDDFVDAKETLPASTAPTSPELDRKPRPSSRYRNPPHNPDAANAKRLEELTLQNAAQKHHLDTLSKRLQVFESSAQQTSAALAQSIRFMARSNPPTPENSHGKMANADDKAASQRIAELEEILRRNDQELAKRDGENVKLKETIGRYRDKWEKLKEGARARRDGGGGGGAGTNSAAAAAAAAKVERSDRDHESGEKMGVVAE